MSARSTGHGTSTTTTVDRQYRWDTYGATDEVLGRFVPVLATFISSIPQLHQFPPQLHQFPPLASASHNYINFHPQLHQFSLSLSIHCQLYQFPPQITSISTQCMCFSIASYLQCENGTLPWTTAEPSAVHPNKTNGFVRSGTKLQRRLYPLHAVSMLSTGICHLPSACLNCRPHNRGRQLHGVYASLQRESHAANVLFLTRLLQPI